MTSPSVESVLATNHIDNPADASLVRLVFAATSLSEAPLQEILQRSSFSNPADEALAKALAEAARAGIGGARRRAPTPVVAWAVAACLGFAVVALGTGAISSDRKVSELTGQLAVQHSQIESYVKKLASATSTTETVADSISRGLASTKTYVDRNEALIAENARLSAENAQLRMRIVQLEAAVPAQAATSEARP